MSSMMHYREYLGYYNLEDTLESYAKYLYYKSPFVKTLPEENIMGLAKYTWESRFIDVGVPRTIKK